MNLWWPAQVAEDLVSDGCTFGAGADDIGPLVFIGNLALVVGTLLGILLLHVVVISGVEAHWLCKVRELVVPYGLVFFCHFIYSASCRSRDLLSNCLPRIRNIFSTMIKTDRPNFFFLYTSFT